MNNEDKITLLEKENELLKEKLKNYTAPKRSKKFYENHKEEIKKKVREYKEKTNYNINMNQTNHTMDLNHGMIFLLEN